MSGEQLELFPELNWKEVEYKGKFYRRYTGGITTPYRKRVEQQRTLHTNNRKRNNWKRHERNRKIISNKI